RSRAARVRCRPLASQRPPTPASPAGSPGQRQTPGRTRTSHRPPWEVVQSRLSGRTTPLAYSGDVPLAGPHRGPHTAGTDENTASMIAHQERCDFLAKVRRDALAAGRRAQCDLLRDLFGCPARPVAVDGTWRTPAVRSVAQVIYDEGRFEDLPILAD